jgi:hypothetical protein
MLIGTNFHPNNAEIAATGGSTSNAFLAVLLIRSIILLLGDSVKIPEPRNDTEQEKYQREPRRRLFKKAVQAIADGKPNKGGNDKVETHRACIEELPEKRFFSQERPPLTHFFILDSESASYDPGDLL